jgi:hypothetical protein
MKKKIGFEKVLEYLDENPTVWMGKSTDQVGRLLLKKGFKKLDIQEAFLVQVFNSEQYGGQ